MTKQGYTYVVQRINSKDAVHITAYADNPKAALAIVNSVIGPTVIVIGDWRGNKIMSRSMP